MYHSITFKKGDIVKNTWDDWRLINTERTVFQPPPLKSKYIDLPGEDGQLDFTETLAGKPNFGNVTGSFTLLLLPDNWDYYSAYAEIIPFLHGHRLQLSLEATPEVHRNGRFAVTTFKTGEYYTTLVIDYNVDPYDTPGILL